MYLSLNFVELVPLINIKQFRKQSTGNLSQNNMSKYLIIIQETIKLDLSKMVIQINFTTKILASYNKQTNDHER